MISGALLKGQSTKEFSYLGIRILKNYAAVSHFQKRESQVGFIKTIDH